MMDSLRRGASGLLVKAFLAVLVLSFVVWGVADVFRGYGSRAVATVAGREIQPEQFQRAFEQEYQRIQSQYGQSVTREMARKFGLETQVLSRLVQETLLDVNARDLKLGLSDQAVLDTIKQDPTFQGANGEFSKEHVRQSVAGEWIDRERLLRDATRIAGPRTDRDRHARRQCRAGDGGGCA